MSSKWRVWWPMLLLSVATVGTGVYLALLRPMLPEDARFTGVPLTLLPAAMLQWLGIVFRTWGTFTIAFGRVIGGVAAFLTTRDERWLRRGTALGIAVAFDDLRVHRARPRGAGNHGRRRGLLGLTLFAAVGSGGPAEGDWWW